MLLCEVFLYAVSSKGVNLDKKSVFKRVPLLWAFIIGLLVGCVIESRIIDKEKSTQNYEIRQGGYSLINPLLECDVPKDKNLEPFKHKVEALVHEKAGSNKSNHLSVYFRDLNNGQWFGINESEEFSPASLLKVSTMMAYFKIAEASPEILSKKIKFNGTYNYNAMENIKPSVTITPGQTYTIEELIYRMVAHSDNNANSLVLDYIDPMLLQKTFKDLGINLPDISKPEDFMSVKNYASFFRILFNASYLSKDMSSKALEYLTRADFKAGLVSGVPSNIVVAHKFGERALGPQSEIKELHDCGIVYYPAHPYLLCVMSKGNDFGYLANSIKDLSRLVFEEVNHQHTDS